jgi:hypothetical protein
MPIVGYGTDIWGFDRAYHPPLDSCPEKPMSANLKSVGTASARGRVSKE